MFCLRTSLQNTCFLNSRPKDETEEEKAKREAKEAEDKLEKERLDGIKKLERDAKKDVEIHSCGNSTFKCATSGWCARAEDGKCLFLMLSTTGR